MENVIFIHGFIKRYTLMSLKSPQEHSASSILWLAVANFVSPFATLCKNSLCLSSSSFLVRQLFVLTPDQQSPGSTL